MKAKRKFSSKVSSLYNCLEYVKKIPWEHSDAWIGGGLATWMRRHHRRRGHHSGPLG